MSTNIHTIHAYLTHIRGEKTFVFVMCDMWHCFRRLVICMCRVHQKMCMYSTHWTLNKDNNILMSSMIRNHQKKPPPQNRWLNNERFFSSLLLLLVRTYTMHRVHLADIFDFHHRPMYKLFSFHPPSTSPIHNGVVEHWMMLADIFMIIIFNWNARKSS